MMIQQGVTMELPYLRLTAWAVGAVLAAGTHWKAYTLGEAHTQAAWNEDKITQQEAALTAEAASRAKEQQWTDQLRKANDAYQLEKKARIAAAAQLDAGLRNFRETLYGLGEPPKTPAAPSGTNGTGGLERELLSSCAAALSGLAKEADRLEGKVVGLQNYIRSQGLSE